MDIQFSHDHFAACRQVLLTAGKEGAWTESKIPLPVPRELSRLIAGRDKDTIQQAWTWALITGLGISVLIFEHPSAMFDYRQVVFNGGKLHQASINVLRLMAPPLAKCFEEVRSKLQDKYIAWRQTF